MPRKGETLSPEIKERMREAQRRSLARKEAGLPPQGRRNRARRNAIPAVVDDFEDVSLPQSQPAMTEPDPVPSPPITGDPNDPYNLWLMVLEPDTRELFSEAELRELFEEQRARAAAEKKTRRKKEISELALSTARSDLGLLPAQKIEAMRVAALNAKQVSMLVQMPPAQDNGGPADVGLRIDGKIIENGRRHFCTYGEAASIREMLYRHGQHELLFRGQNLRYRAYLMGQAMGSVNTIIDHQQRDT